MGLFSSFSASTSNTNGSGVKHNNIVIVCGSGGTGVGALVRDAMERFPQVSWCVSFTTREPRPTEVHGVDYMFVTVEEMNKMIRNDDFLEYAQVHGDFYGTSMDQVEKFVQQSQNESPKVLIVTMDVQGVKLAKQREHLQDAHYVFVSPSSMEDLRETLVNRGVDSIRKRVSAASRHVKFAESKGNFDIVLKAPSKPNHNPLATVIKEWFPTLQDVIMPRPVVFCGPSGVGKGTLIEMLQHHFQPDQFGFSVSHTTRKPREGEVDGVHYNFTTVEQIKQEIEDGLFVEYAEVHGNYYGTSIAAIESVQSAGQVCILDIDIQGVQSVKTSDLKPIYLFIAPPSMMELERRLRGRNTETNKAVEQRLENAKAELLYGQEAGNFDRIFVNADLQATFQDMVMAFQEWYPQLRERHDDDDDDAPNRKTCTTAATSSCVVS